jgi:hypothetical protein
VPPGNGPDDKWFRDFDRCEVADADQQENRSYQVMGDVCAPGLKDRIVVRVNVADLCLRTGRMVMPKVSMKEPVRMVVVLLVLMVVLKRRLEERKR